MEKKTFPLFPNFSMFFKAFHQKVWVKYQLGVLNTCLLVKNIITNIRTKFKVFQITFPPYFYHFFPTLLTFSDFILPFDLLVWKTSLKGLFNELVTKDKEWKDAGNHEYWVRQSEFCSLFSEILFL